MYLRELKDVKTSAAASFSPELTEDQLAAHKLVTELKAKYKVVETTTFSEDGLTRTVRQEWVSEADFLLFKQEISAFNADLWEANKQHRVAQGIVQSIEEGI